MEYYREKCHLVMTNLKPYMDKHFILKLFEELGEPLQGYRFINNKLNGDPISCFLHFKKSDAALSVLYKFDGQKIRDTNDVFDLKVAHSSLVDERFYNGIWLGNLRREVTTDDIQKLLIEKEVKYKRINLIKDSVGISKGYAFVEMNSFIERKKSIYVLNGYMGLGGDAPLLVRDAEKKYSNVVTPRAENFGIFISRITTDVQEKKIRDFLTLNHPSFTDLSRPYKGGYVKAFFLNEKDRDKAIANMNSTKILEKKLRVTKYIKNHFTSDQPRPNRRDVGKISKIDMKIKNVLKKMTKRLRKLKLANQAKEVVAAQAVEVAKKAEDMDVDEATEMQSVVPAHVGLIAENVSE